MILVLDPAAPGELLAELRREAEALGWRAELSRGVEQTILALYGQGDLRALGEVLRRHPEVDVIPILSGRDYWRARSRRRFVTGVAGGLGALMAAGVAVPILGFLLPPRAATADPDLMRVATEGEIPPGGSRLVSFRGRPLIVVHRADGSYHAVSAICTHMGVCRLEWSAERHQLLCPCHGAAFDLHGNVLRGPASVPLPTYPVERASGQIYLRRES